MVRVSLLVLVFAGAMVSYAADWPQWRGPLRNGVSAETGWSNRWPASGPRKLWSAQVGEGFSSVAVKGQQVYTLGNANNRDTVFCLNADTGQAKWRYSYACNPGYEYTGPRATPTVDANQVYTISREGLAHCLNAATGKLVWRTDLRKETGAGVPQWGIAGSGLLEGNLVIFNVGTAGAAVDRTTGRLAWKTGSYHSGYSSPLAYTMGNQRGVAIFTATGIAALNPATGRRLWQHPWDTSYEVNAADPIISGNHAFISSNYNRGCALLRLSGGRPSVVWENRNMRNHFNSCVLVDGYIYGNDQHTLKCLDWKTGEERWQRRGVGNGGLIAADGKLIVLTERGVLNIVRASPERYTELASAQVLRGTCWTHPVLANGRIYCRNHEGELVCLDVSAKT